MSTNDDIGGWARILAQADLTFSLGEVGVMAMSPERFGELFEPYFAGERAQQRYRHLAQTVVEALHARQSA